MHGSTTKTAGKSQARGTYIYGKKETQTETDRQRENDRQTHTEKKEVIDR